MQIIIVALIFYLSRIISGLAAVNFHGARNTECYIHLQVLQTGKRVNMVMLAVQLILCVTCMCMCSIVTAMTAVVVSYR